MRNQKNHFRKVIKKNILIACVFLLSIPALIPLFQQGFFRTDDGGWMVIRFSAFHQALVSGQFPVRFLPRLNFEYGYPVANFLYPGFMYLGELLRIFKMDFVTIVKVLFGLSLFSSSVFTYFWLSKVFNRWAAATAGLVYLYSPYHLQDAYTRGSLGEVLALAVVPFIFWMIERNNFFFVVLGIGFLLLSHNTLALFFLPILFIYLLIHSKDIRFSVIQFLLGVGLATFFWLPALYDLQFTVFSQTKISDWQQYFAKLETIGLMNCIIFILVAIILFFSKQLHSILSKSDQEHYTEKQRRLTVFFFLLTGFAIFFSLPLSTPLWYVLPVSVVQFPFRVLSIETLGVAFLSAFFVYILKRQFEVSLSVVIVALSIFLSFPFLKNIVYEEKAEGFYATNEATTTVRNEYMPKWVETLPKKRPEQKVVAPEADFSNLSDQGNKISFEITVSKNTDVTVHTIYFPGWQAKVDSKPVKIGYNDPRGLIHIPISAGKHTVEVYFTETPIRMVSNIVSLISFGILLTMCLLERLKQKAQKSSSFKE